jgi:hypothetical protein
MRTKALVQMAIATVFALVMTRLALSKNRELVAQGFDPVGAVGMGVLARAAVHSEPSLRQSARAAPAASGGRGGGAAGGGGGAGGAGGRGGDGGGGGMRSTPQRAAAAGGAVAGDGGGRSRATQFEQFTGKPFDQGYPMLAEPELPSPVDDIRPLLAQCPAADRGRGVREGAKKECDCSAQHFVCGMSCAAAEEFLAEKMMHWWDHKLPNRAFDHLCDSIAANGEGILIQGVEKVYAVVNNRLYRRVCVREKRKESIDQDEATVLGQLLQLLSMVAVPNAHLAFRLDDYPGAPMDTTPPLPLITFDTTAESWSIPWPTFEHARFVLSKAGAAARRQERGALAASGQWDARAAKVYWRGAGTGIKRMPPWALPALWRFRLIATARKRPDLFNAQLTSFDEGQNDRKALGWTAAEIAACERDYIHLDGCTAAMASCSTMGPPAMPGKCALTDPDKAGSPLHCVADKPPSGAAAEAADPKNLAGFHKAVTSHKYAMIVDGTTSAWRTTHTLATGAVMVRQVSQHAEHFYHLLRPWVHYVPVRKDLSDLIQKVEWLRDHDAEAAAISRRARAFVAERLRPQDLFCYIYRLVSAMGRIQDGGTITEAYLLGKGYKLVSSNDIDQDVIPRERMKASWGKHSPCTECAAKHA